MRGSLHAKVFAVTALIAVSLVLGLTTYFSDRHETSTRHALEAERRLHFDAASRGVDPIVAFDDAERLAEETLAAERTSAFSVGLLALLVGLGGAWLVARSLGKRLGQLASAASQLAESAAPAARLRVSDEDDEIGRLSGSFDVMRLVAAQKRELELILANVVKGFVIVDRAGRMGEHHSAVMDRWFGVGAVTQGATFWSLFREAPRVASHLELAWEGLFDEFLPVEVALDQFPKTLRRGAVFLELSVHPIRNDEGRLESALIDLRDVTELRLRDAADATRADLMALCERALSDRDSVLDFVTEGDSIHRAIEIGETLDDLRRAMHTLKGVSAQHGAIHIAEMCHAIELSMAESENGAPKPADIAALTVRWNALTSRLRVLFANATPRLSVTKAELEALLSAMASFEHHALLARRTRMLMLEPVQIRLDRVKNHARALGARLGKELEVTGSAYGLRCDPVVWAPFWGAFTHVVHNALDHGIEIPDVRIAHGKTESGHLSIDVMRRKGNVVVEVMEDGAGIDWQAIAKKARALGLPAESRADLEQALFADGLSTRETLGDLSGRGLGLASIRAVTEKMGGRVTVVSMRGVGTTLRFTFPVAALGAAYAEEDTRVVAGPSAADLRSAYRLKTSQESPTLAVRSAVAP